MEKVILDYVVEKTRQLMDAPTCSSETKQSAQKWLDTLGTEQEATETKKYVAELEADIMPIETLIDFAESDQGAQVFGAEKSKEIADHAKGIQVAGEKYCDCPACVVVAQILEKKDALIN